MLTHYLILFFVPNDIIQKWLEHIKNLNNSQTDIYYTKSGTLVFLYKRLKELKVTNQEYAIGLIKVAIENNWTNIKEVEPAIIFHHLPLIEQMEEERQEALKNP